MKYKMKYLGQKISKCIPRSKGGQFCKAFKNKHAMAYDVKPNLSFDGQNPNLWL